MYNFKSFLIVEAAVKGTIGHLEHIADRTFDGRSEAYAVVNKVKGLAKGKFSKTIKKDDKISVVVKKHKDGRVGVKYKGAGSDYNYSEADVEKQHGHKPYLAGPLKHLVKHVHKILPKREGEWQGGYLSAHGDEHRHEDEHHVGHTPNTITYKAHKDSEEGKKLKHSKVSVVMHSEIKNGETHPANHTEFRHHPDVHVARTHINPEERVLDKQDAKVIHHHISAAHAELEGHGHDHHVGHEGTMRQYINHTVRHNTVAHAQGYHDFLRDKHNKDIDKVKNKDKKIAERDKALAHVKKHKEAFDRSFRIHSHVQLAVNHMARALSKKNAGGFSTSIGGKTSGGEGFVARSKNHIGKVVDRPEFSAANFARSAILKAKKSA